MRVLVAHNRYQQAGGEDRVVACEMAMLASRGHDVELLDFDNEAIIDIAGRTLGALNSFYSTSSRVLVEQRLAAFRPDILHVHNFMPSLSPSVFFAAKTADVPVVQTLHNYRLICANGQLFRDGAPCEDCLRHGSFLPGILHACYRGSRIGSAVIGAGMAAQSLTGTWEHRVDRYIALTAFSASKFAQSRIPGHKVRVKPNFVPDPGVGTGDGGFALFAGRLSAEKGVMTLIAADDLDRLPCPVYIAGEGPLAKVVEAASMRPGSKLVVLGQKTNQQVLELMKKAAVLIFPSLWYEPFGLVMIEALACGLPVIASRIGGLPELVEDQVSGLLYQAGSPQGLCEAVELFLSSQEKVNAMRAAARQRFEQYYSETTNYKLLLDIYEELLQERVLAYPALIHGS